MPAILHYKFYDKTKLFRLTVILDLSSKTKDLISVLILQIRPNACHHFKFFCTLALRPQFIRSLFF